MFPRDQPHFNPTPVSVLLLGLKILETPTVTFCSCPLSWENKENKKFMEVLTAQFSRTLLLGWVKTTRLASWTGVRQVCAAGLGTGWKQESAQEPTSPGERYPIEPVLSA